MSLCRSMGVGQGAAISRVPGWTLAWRESQSVVIFDGRLESRGIPRGVKEFINALRD